METSVIITAYTYVNPNDYLVHYVIDSLPSYHLALFSATNNYDISDILTYIAANEQISLSSYMTYTSSLFDDTLQHEVILNYKDGIFDPKLETDNTTLLEPLVIFDFDDSYINEDGIDERYLFKYTLPKAKLAYPEPYIASPSYNHPDLTFLCILQYWY